MRWIGRLLVICLLASSLWIWVKPVVEGLWEQSRSIARSMDYDMVNSFFPLSSERWLTFDIPKNSTLFRFYAHAALKNDVGENTASYVIDYQWLDQQGAVLEERQHHITTRASATRPMGNLTDQEVPSRQRFYDHQRSIPSSDHALYFNATTYPDANSLRLKASSTEEFIDQIGIRPYQQFHRLPERIDIAWQRMSSEQRERISKGSLYPSFLLSEYERRNLLATYWKPIGPLGVLDKDYTIETLYQHESEPGKLPPETPTVGWLYTGPQHWVTLLLPQTRARYRITWYPLPNIGAPESLQLLWQGSDFQRQRQWQATIENNQWEETFEGGLLQVIPDRSSVMKLHQWQDNEWRDITPGKQYTRAFVCTSDSPLEYTLAPGTDLQSLKIDARAYFREDQAEASAHGGVSYELRDQAGVATFRQSVQLSDNNNPYQHFSDASAVNSYLFEPLISYLKASADSQTLLVQCDAPSLISVYSRPWRQPIRRQLPAQENYWYSFEERQPAWFTLMPEDVDTLVRLKRYFSLFWYFKPRNLDNSLAQGDYSWQAITTDQPGALESQVFSSHAGDSQSRMESRQGAYQPVTEPVTFLFAGRSNEKFVQPSAVYLRDSAEPQAVQLWIDQTLALDITIAGTSGRIRMPHLSAGKHHIEFRSEGTGWFVNNTAQTGQTHQLRTAYSNAAPDNNTTSLSFNVDTSGTPQQLGFWLYDAGDWSALDCQVELWAQRDDTALDAHSFLDYEYSLASNEYDVSHVLQRHKTAVRGPIRLTVPLGSDIPAQTLAAQLSCDQPGVMVSAGLISDGQSAYQYFEEQNEAR